MFYSKYDLTCIIIVNSFNLKDILATPTMFAYEVFTEAQMKAYKSPCVFMWWVCEMAPGVELSCAPYWQHPEVSILGLKLLKLLGTIAFLTPNDAGVFSLNNSYR